jgi:uncharacterized Zn-binding protein involved in type VI secretion
MAERPIICVGDTTTHGGTVLEGFANFEVYGRLASGKGHKVRCPRCKGIFVIIEGAENRTVGDVPLALEGMLTSCGAALVASQRAATAETGDIAAASVAFGSMADAASDDRAIGEAAKDYDQQFQVLDEVTGEPVANRRYRLTIGGMRFEGTTDHEGKTQRVSAKRGLDAHLDVLPEGE